MMQNSLVILRGSAGIGVSSLLSKLPNLLAGLIIFFSATQLGIHFLPPSSLVYGIRVDYLSPTLYFLDILIVLFLATRRLLDRRPEQSSSRDTEGGKSLLVGIMSPRSDPLRRSWPTAKMFSRDSKTNRETGSDLIGVFLPIILVNLLYSTNPLATLSWSVHFLLYYLFVGALLRPLGSALLPERTLLKRNSRVQLEKGPVATGRRVLMGTIPIALTISLFFQTCLALTQVLLGHSVGGLLYYLGERNVAVGSPGIALATFMDSVVLRAYGTFGHPNVLAGYAVISLLIILSLRGLSSQDRFPATKGSDPTSRTLLMGTYLPLSLTTLIVLLTQSRSAAISLFGMIIPFYLIGKTKLRTLFLYFIGLGIAISLFTGGLSRQLDISSSQRLTLQGLSLSVIKGYPIFGTGAQASISTYPLVDSSARLLQPDHNSFTLFLSWFGLFGVLAILSIFPRLEKLDELYKLVTFLPLLLLDHYLLTSPQGLFIFLLYIFIIKSSDKPIV